MKNEKLYKVPATYNELLVLDGCLKAAMSKLLQSGATIPPEFKTIYVEILRQLLKHKMESE